MSDKKNNTITITIEHVDGHGVARSEAYGMRLKDMKLHEGNNIRNVAYHLAVSAGSRIRKLLKADVERSR